METAIAQQIKELKAYMFLTPIQELFIKTSMELCFMEGEKAQMIKQMEGLKNGN